VEEALEPPISPDMPISETGIVRFFALIVLVPVLPVAVTPSDASGPFFHPQRKNQTAAHSKSLQQLGHAGHQDLPWVQDEHDGANVSV
jgi:hypothetical protein